MDVVVVESPLLEALVFDYGVVLQNLWALVALLTAAVSFWKIRSASPTPPTVLREECNCVSESDTTASSPLELAAEAEVEAAAGDEIENDGEVVAVETKGNKLMLKYHYHVHNDDEEVLEERLFSDEYDYKREVVVCWQWQMKMKREIVEWHDRYLDMGMLNGNIVRLWDHCY